MQHAAARKSDFGRGIWKPPKAVFISMPVENSRPGLEHFSISKPTTASTASPSGRIPGKQDVSVRHPTHLGMNKMAVGSRLREQGEYDFLTCGGAGRPRKIRG
jgi:hypothetical protein